MIRGSQEGYRFFQPIEEKAGAYFNPMRFSRLELMGAFRDDARDSSQPEEPKGTAHGGGKAVTASAHPHPEP